MSGARGTATTAPAPALTELAERVGVQARYVDGFGVERGPSTEALLAILRARGLPVDSVADAEHLARAPRPADLEPVVVAWDGHVPQIDVRPPPGTRSIRWTLTPEHGEVVTWDGAADATGVATLDVPERLDSGYYALDVEAGDWERRSLVVAAPPVSWRDGRRRRGVFVPLYALHSRLSWSTGNFGDLGELAAWVSGTGANVVGTLPLLAAFLDAPCEPSPYSPVSRMFWNELYVEVEAVPDVEHSRRARRLLRERRQQIAELRAGATVDHAGQAALAREVLEVALADVSPARRRAFEQYLAAHPDTLDYARFRATAERHGRAWRSWPDGATADPDAAEFHAYAQWVAQAQVGRLTRVFHSYDVDLFLDLPLGAHPDGYDQWRFRSAFAEGVSAGAPPDAFFEEGQNWGLAPLDPGGSRSERHEYFRRCLSFQMAPADLLRIDHVMGLHRTYWIPDGFSATDGAYVRYPAEELYALVSLESHRHRCRVVGEDLGTVPEEVREEMDRRGLARTVVAQFELPAEPGGEIEPPPPGSLAMVGTHDTATFRGFWDDDEHRGERDALVRFLADRGLAGSGDPGDVLAGLHAWLGSGPAEMVVANLEDLWLEPAPQNVPGTTEGNWCRRVPQPMEQWTGRRDVHERLVALVRNGHPHGGERA